MTPLVKDPVYLQLHKALRETIADGHGVGGRFLTEREVSAQFGVSRATANKALSSLVAEGLLEFRKGVGTFVRSQPLDYDLHALVSFSEKAAQAGKRPTTRVLAFRRVPARKQPEAAAALEVAETEDLFYLERLRLADGLPVILERRYIAAAHCPKLSRGDVEKSLYAAWTTKHGLQIAGADQAIRAVALGADDARLLGVRRGMAGLMVTSKGFLHDRRPLWTETTLYRGDAYEFRNTLGPIRGAGPAAGVLLDVSPQ